MRISPLLASITLASLTLMPMSTFAKNMDGSVHLDAGLHLGQKLSHQVKEVKNEIKEKALDLKDIIKKMTIKGTVTAISGSDVTIKKNDGTTVLVHTAGATLVRRYGASMSLADIQINDELEVFGTVTTPTEMTGLYIRNNSLQARNGTFSGTVSSVNMDAKTFVLKTNNRSEQTIMVATSTKMTKNGDPATFADLATGKTVRVSGIWNRTNENVTATAIAISTPLVQVHVEGKVTVDGDSQVTLVTDDQKTYVIDLSKASFYYSNYLRMNKKEIQVGDRLDVWARAEAGATTLKPYFVRNLSQTNKTTRVINVKDQNNTVQAQVGDRVKLNLGNGYIWSTATSSNAVLLAPVVGKTSTFDAKAVGQATIDVVGQPRCTQSTPVCATPSINFRVTVNVVAK